MFIVMVVAFWLCYVMIPRLDCSRSYGIRTSMCFLTFASSHDVQYDGARALV